MPCVLLLPCDDRERRSAVLEIVVGIGFGAIFLTKGVASL
jgi:hypothetical protein